MNKRKKKFIDKRCHVCKRPDAGLLDVHRIVPGELGGKYTQQNTVTICALCHRRVHCPEPTLVIEGWYQSTKGRVLHFWDYGEEKFE